MDSLLSIVLAMGISFMGIRLLRPFAVRIGLIDTPSHRKRHQGAIPLVGGLALYMAVATTSIMLPDAAQRVHLLLACAGILVVIGALDDKFDIPASARLSIQILVSFAMMIGSGVSLSHFGNLLGFGNIELGVFALPVTALAIVTAINAFNMVDGIDGLLGAHTLVSVGSIGLLMLLSGSHPFLIVALALFAALIPYMICNLGFSSCSGKKIFMGDAGSMLIGFAVVWLLIEGTQGEHMSFRPVTAIWLIALPLMDLVSTFLRRIRKGHSPLVPDRTHLHHIIQRMGYTPRQALFIITAMAAVMAGFGIMGELLQLSEPSLFVTFMVTFALYEYSFGRHAWKMVRTVKRRQRTAMSKT